MKAWAIKSGNRYIGYFGRHGILVKAMLYETRKELFEHTGLLTGERVIKVEIKEVKDESVCN